MVSGRKGEDGNETMGFTTMTDWISAWNVCLVPVVVVVEIVSRPELILRGRKRHSRWWDGCLSLERKEGNGGPVSLPGITHSYKR